MQMVITVVQMRVAQADPAANIASAERSLRAAAERGSGLVVFPEMWTTGFRWEYNSGAARDADTVVAEVARLAKRYRVWVAGSMLTLSGKGRASNAVILLDAAGREVSRYAKTHLFSLIHEDAHLDAGDTLVVAETPWGATGFAVCYDIRFPEVFRTLALRGARIVLVPAAFPLQRIHHWKTLVRARAIEEQLYMVGANQTGEETLASGERIVYGGSSCVIDPAGETVAEAGEAGEALLTVSIDMARVDEIRARMHCLSDRRPELYK